MAKKKPFKMTPELAEKLGIIWMDNVRVRVTESLNEEDNKLLIPYAEAYVKPDDEAKDVIGALLLDAYLTGKKEGVQQEQDEIQKAVTKLTGTLFGKPVGRMPFYPFSHPFFIL